MIELVSKRVMLVAAITFLVMFAPLAQAGTILDPSHTPDAGGLTGNGSKLAAGDTIVIQAADEGHPSPGVCLSVYNASTLSYFVPWNTPREWTAFQSAVQTSMATMQSDPTATNIPLYKVALTGKCCMPTTLYAALTTNPLPNQNPGQICSVDAPSVNLGERWLGVHVDPQTLKNVDIPYTAAQGDLYTVLASDLLNNPAINFRVTLVCQDGQWVETNGTNGSCVPMNGQCALSDYSTNPPTAGFASVPTSPGSLCAAGSLLDPRGVSVNSLGLWSWVCDGTPGMSNATCLASNPSTQAQCGPASAAPPPPSYTQSTPPSADQLCLMGNATGDGALRWLGGTTWHWACYDAPSNTRDWCATYDANVPQCGSAGWQTLASAPSQSTLCAKGATLSAGSFVTYSSGNSPAWSWNCTAPGYSSPPTYCEAYITGSDSSPSSTCGSANAIPSASIPSSNLCALGSTASPVGEISLPHATWTWTCNDGVAPPSSCSAPAQSQANGVCGSTSGTTVPYAPDYNLCSFGEPSAVAGSGPWTWTCQGVSGGRNSPQCTARLCQACSGTINGVDHSYPRSVAALCSVTGNASWSETDILTSDNSQTAVISWNDTLGSYAQPMPSTLAPAQYCKPCYQRPQGNVASARTRVTGRSGMCSASDPSVGGLITPWGTPAVTYQ